MAVGRDLNPCRRAHEREKEVNKKAIKTTWKQGQSTSSSHVEVEVSPVVARTRKILVASLLSVFCRSRVAFTYAYCMLG